VKEWALVHDFNERLKSSKDMSVVKPALDWLLGEIPGALKYYEAETTDDKRGVDYWYQMENGTRAGVDLKKRDRPFPGDVCVEICSVYKGSTGDPMEYLAWYDPNKCEAIGWSVDMDKITDIVLFSWAAGTNMGPHYWKSNFSQFRQIAMKNWEIWASAYGLRGARNRGYVTLCVFPPMAIVEELLADAHDEEPE
jgi:hypothetical protein